MDEELSSKFIWSLSKFLRSLCNGYVDFDDGVELIGHIYLNVDGGKTGRKLNYFLNERVYKNDTLITFISNSFHAQPEYKGEGKEGDGKKNEEAGGASESVSRSAVPSNKYQADIQAGSKRPGSPLSAPTPPTQRRMQSSKVKGPVGSPAKIVPSSASSSSQDNDPSPWQESKNGSEISGPASNQSNNATADNENNSVPPNVETINHLPDLASFLDTMTGDDQSSQDQRSLPGVKPDIDNDFDLTHVKQESVSEPSSCAQAGSAEQAETPEQEHVTAEIKREVDMTDAMPNISQPTCQPQDSSWVKSEFHIKIEAPEEVPHPIEHRTQNPGHISDGICPEWPAATNRHISSDIHPESDAISTVTMSTGNSETQIKRYTGVKRYMCTECKSSFTRSSDLKRHIRRHTGVKPYKCTECGASFAESGSLKRHMPRHTGIKPYKCTECEASFTQLGSLKTHMWRHTGVKPFQCTECEASFTVSCNLKIHMSRHTGVKPYKCMQCEASFIEPSSLKRHMRKHTGVKP